QADGWGVGRVAELIVYYAQVEVHLAGVLGLEGPFLQVDDHERPQPEVVEEQVDVEVLITDFDAVLPADEGEPLTEFEQEALEVTKEPGLQFPLVERFFQGHEVEDVRILQRLSNQVRLRGREPVGEVADRSTLASVGVALDHQREDVS